MKVRSLMVYAAKTQGIPDQAMFEQPWVADWVQNNQSRLRYDPIRRVWRWDEYPTVEKKRV